MSYYKQNFVSAEPLFAKIELEMKTYFNAGMLDNLLFPVWTKYCLDRLGKGSYPLRELLLVVEDYQSKLPSDFVSVREARMCTSYGGVNYKLPSYFYKSETYQLDNHSEHIDRCAPCDPCNLCQRSINVVYKTETTVCTNSYKTLHLLKPGNISALSKCSNDCLNLRVDSMDTFDIHGDKFVTNFTSGDVFLTYYSSESDEQGTNLIPDNAKTQDYIEKHIKYKLFELLSNQVTDETYNQIESKCQKYDMEAAMAFIAADTETKKGTDKNRIDKIKNTLHRHDKYNIK